MKIILLLLALGVLEASSAARLARNCNFKWSLNYRCYADGVQKSGVRDSTFPVPANSDKRRLENAVNDCFVKQFRCSTGPLPTGRQASDRNTCFSQTKKSLQTRLQQCVRQTITDFNMPDDPYDPQNDWGYTVTTVQNTLRNPRPLCGNADKNSLANCVYSTGYDFKNRRAPNKIPPYVCQADADCWYNWGTDCQNTWEYQALPQLCQCSQDMQKQKAVKNAQDQYKSCLSSKGQTMAKDDPVLKWVDTYLRGMCNTASNYPCKKERETASRRSTNFG